MGRATAELRSDKNWFCIPNRAVNQCPSSTLLPVREPLCLSEDKRSPIATMQQSQHKSVLKGVKKVFSMACCVRRRALADYDVVSSSLHKGGVLGFACIWVFISCFPPCLCGVSLCPCLMVSAWVGLTYFWLLLHLCTPAAQPRQWTDTPAQGNMW